jgi:hypothetical protein
VDHCSGIGLLIARSSINVALWILGKFEGTTMMTT